MRHSEKPTTTTAGSTGNNDCITVTPMPATRKCA